MYGTKLGTIRKSLLIPMLKNLIHITFQIRSVCWTKTKHSTHEESHILVGVAGFQARGANTNVGACATQKATEV